MQFAENATLVSPGFLTLAEAISAVTEWLMRDLESKTAAELQVRYRGAKEPAKSVVFDAFREGELPSYLETKEGKIRRISKQDWSLRYGAVLHAVESNPHDVFITVQGA